MTGGLAAVFPPLIMFAFLSCSRGDNMIALSGLTMGTTWSVKVVPGSPAGPGTPGKPPATKPAAAEREKIWDLVDARLNAVNERMSHYLATSEVTRFNEFDSTEPAQPPSEEEIHQLLGITGIAHLPLDTKSLTLSKDDPAVHINLSSVAKGYGVDQVADALLDAGYRNFMVEVGGEVRVHGHRADGQPWHVAVERPQFAGRSLQEVVTINNGSFATSGDYRNFREVDGRLVSHIIDPNTGRPVGHSLAAVSVLDSLCVRADGFATALLVLGPDKGFALADSLHIAALFLIRKDRDQIEEKATPGFRALLGKPLN
ncbi:MAG: FAD:protein FMN transferase [bacterium]